MLSKPWRRDGLSWEQTRALRKDCGIAGSLSLGWQLLKATVAGKLKGSRTEQTPVGRDAAACASFTGDSGTAGLFQGSVRCVPMLVLVQGWGEGVGLGRRGESQSSASQEGSLKWKHLNCW